MLPHSTYNASHRERSVSGGSWVGEVLLVPLSAFVITVTLAKQILFDK
jgi:hypothetical protein